MYYICSNSKNGPALIQEQVVPVLREQLQFLFQQFEQEKAKTDEDKRIQNLVHLFGTIWNLKSWLQLSQVFQALTQKLCKLLNEIQQLPPNALSHQDKQSQWHDKHWKLSLVVHYYAYAFLTELPLAGYPQLMQNVQWWLEQVWQEPDSGFVPKAMDLLVQVLPIQCPKEIPSDLIEAIYCPEKVFSPDLSPDFRQACMHHLASLFMNIPGKNNEVWERLAKELLPSIRVELEDRWTSFPQPLVYYTVLNRLLEELRTGECGVHTSLANMPFWTLSMENLKAVENPPQSYLEAIVQCWQSLLRLELGTQMFPRSTVSDFLSILQTLATSPDPGTGNKPLTGTWIWSSDPMFLNRVAQLLLEWHAQVPNVYSSDEDGKRSWDIHFLIEIYLKEFWGLPNDIIRNVLLVFRMCISKTEARPVVVQLILPTIMKWINAEEEEEGVSCVIQTQCLDMLFEELNEKRVLVKFILETNGMSILSALGHISYSCHKPEHLQYYASIYRVLQLCITVAQESTIVQDQLIFHSNLSVQCWQLVSQLNQRLENPDFAFLAEGCVHCQVLYQLIEMLCQCDATFGSALAEACTEEEWKATLTLVHAAPKPLSISPATSSTLVYLVHLLSTSGLFHFTNNNNNKSKDDVLLLLDFTETWLVRSVVHYFHYHASHHHDGEDIPMNMVQQWIYPHSCHGHKSPFATFHSQNEMELYLGPEHMRKTYKWIYDLENDGETLEAFQHQVFPLSKVLEHVFQLLVNELAVSQVPHLELRQRVWHWFPYVLECGSWNNRTYVTSSLRLLSFITETLDELDHDDIKCLMELHIHYHTCFEMYYLDDLDDEIILLWCTSLYRVVHRHIFSAKTTIILSADEIFPTLKCLAQCIDRNATHEYMHLSTLTFALSVFNDMYTHQRLHWSLSHRLDLRSSIMPGFGQYLIQHDQEEPLRLEVRRSIEQLVCIQAFELQVQKDMRRRQAYGAGLMSLRTLAGLTTSELENKHPDSYLDWIEEEYIKLLD